MRLAWCLGRSEWQNLLLRRKVQWLSDELEAQPKIVSALTRSLAVAINHPSIGVPLQMGGRAVGRDG